MIWYSLVLVVLFNLIIFLFAFYYRTDKLTDLSYAISFVILIVFGLVSRDVQASKISLISASLVFFWALRLGYFLFRRVLQIKKDHRFDQIRTSKIRFFRFFLLQGVSVWLINLPLTILLLSNSSLEPGSSKLFFTIPLGWIIAFGGLMLESVADWQKGRFKSLPGNKSKLYTSGLYSHIRYPNYLGEILFWFGIFISSIFVLNGIEWLSLASPVWISILLVWISGIPLLEKDRARRYKMDSSYERYVNETYKLIPGVY